MNNVAILNSQLLVCDGDIIYQSKETFSQSETTGLSCSIDAQKLSTKRPAAIQSSQDKILSSCTNPKKMKEIYFSKNIFLKFYDLIKYPPKKCGVNNLFQ